MMLNPFAIPDPSSFLSSSPIADTGYGNYTGSYAQAVQPQQAQAPQAIPGSRPAFLANGARGFFTTDLTVRDTQLDIYIPVDANMKGVDTLLSKMLLEGSPATKAMLSQLKSYGIEAGVSPTGGDKVILSLNGPAGQEAMLANTALQLLTRPMIDPMTFKAAKNEILQNLSSMKSMPEVPLSNALDKQLYGANHPYATGLEETLQHINRLNPAQVVGMLQASMADPQGVAVAMTSSASIEQQQAAVNQAIQSNVWTASPWRRPIPVAPPVQNRTGHVGPVLVPNEQTQRAVVLTKWKVPTPGDPDYLAYKVLESVLSRMGSGRFFNVLRVQKGLVYGTQSQYSSQKQGADFSAKAEVEFDKINDTISAFKEIMQDLCRRPISMQEMNAVKKSMLFEIRSELQQGSGISDLNSPFLNNDRMPMDSNTLIQALNMVSPWDVQRVANRIFNPRSGLTVFGVTAPSQVLNQTFGRTR